MTSYDVNALVMSVGGVYLLVTGCLRGNSPVAWSALQDEKGGLTQGLYFFLVSFLDYFHWDAALVVEDLWSIGRNGMFIPLVM